MGPARVPRCVLGGRDAAGQLVSAGRARRDRLVPYYPTGSSGHTVYVFEQNVALESGKTVEAVTLPDLGGVAGCNPAQHVFAMAIGG